MTPESNPSSQEQRNHGFSLGNSTRPGHREILSQRTFIMAVILACDHHDMGVLWKGGAVALCAEVQGVEESASVSTFAG